MESEELMNFFFPQILKMQPVSHITLVSACALASLVGSRLSQPPGTVRSVADYSGPIYNATRLTALIMAPEKEKPHRQSGLRICLYSNPVQSDPYRWKTEARLPFLLTSRRAREKISILYNRKLQNVHMLTYHTLIVIS